MGRAANEPRWHKGQPANECLGLRRLWGLEFQHTARAIAPLAGGRASGSSRTRSPSRATARLRAALIRRPCNIPIRSTMRRHPERLSLTQTE